MAVTYDSLLLRNQADIDRRLVEDHLRLARETAVRMMYHTQSDGTVPNTRQVKKAIEEDVWGEVLLPYYIGQGNHPLIENSPQSPYTKTVVGGIRRATQVQVERQIAMLKRTLDDPEIVNWLTSPRPAALMFPDTPEPEERARFDRFQGLRGPDGRVDFARARADLVRPRSEYDALHRWVDPSGHTLSDRVWNTAENVRERIDRLMDYHIGRGTAAVDIAKELERFLTPGAAGMLTTTPYGTEGSYAARRLARTEITVGAHRATVLAAQTNPMAGGVQWKLSPQHPEYDICDELARGGPNRDGIYPIDQVPAVPHPHCLCNQVPVPIEDREAVVARLRDELRKSRGDLMTVVGPEGEAQLKGILNPEYLTDAIMNGSLEKSVEQAVYRVRPSEPVGEPRVTLRPDVTTAATAPELVGDVVVFQKGGQPLADPLLNGIPLADSTQPAWELIPDKTDFVEPPLDLQGLKVSAGIIIVEDDGRIWLAEPTGHFGGYEHTFPKGGLEPGLTLQQTARKEVFEETGIQAEIVDYLTDGKGTTSMTRYYIGKRVGGNPLSMGWESQAVKLVTPEEAAKLLNVKRDKETLAKLVDYIETEGIPPTPELTELNFPELAAESPVRREPAAAPDPVVQVAANPALTGPSDAEVGFLPNTPKSQHKRLLPLERDMRRSRDTQMYVIGRRGGILGRQVDPRGEIYPIVDFREQLGDKLIGSTITLTRGTDNASEPITMSMVRRATLDGVGEIRSVNQDHTYTLRFDRSVWKDFQFRDRMNTAIDEIDDLVREELARDPAWANVAFENFRVEQAHRVMSRLAHRFDAIDYLRIESPSDDLVEMAIAVLEGRAPTVTAPPPIEEPEIPARPGFLAGGFPDDLERLEQVRRLGGSTGAIQVRDPRDGRLYVMKRGASEEHLRAEVAADRAYRALGVKVPGLHLYETDTGPVKLAEWIEGDLLGDLRRSDPARYEAARRELQRDFAVDATFMAWDVAGTGFDNILVDADGVPWRIDNGGSFLFRAQGAIKPQATHNKWLDEIWTMRDRNVNEYAAQIFGDTDYSVIGRRLADIGARRQQILAVLPDDLKPLMAERLEMAADYGQIATQFLDDRWRSNKVEDFTRVSIDIRRNTDLLERLPKQMTGEPRKRGRQRVYVRDEHGKLWDDLRDRDGQTGLVSRIAEYMAQNGMSHKIIQEWAREQARDSWEPLAQAFKYHIVQERDKDPKTTYFWRHGFDKARQHYEDAIQRYGEETYRKTWEFWRVINYEFLRNVDFKFNDRQNGMVTLIRSEENSVMEMYNMRVGKTGRMTRGAAESTSIYDAVFVFGTETTRQSVPHHRIFGNYFFDQAPGGNKALFAGDGENEFVAMLDDLDVDYLGRHKNI